MSTRREKDRLKQLSRERSFRIERRGDSHFGVADGYKAKRIMFRGNTTPAGTYLESKGVHLPRNRLNKTMRTVFRGNSEYAFTESGSTVRLRNPDGGLTARGREMYTQDEITVEVPAIQMGTNKLNERYRIETYKVFTENEFPEIGETFRNTPGNDVAKFRAVHQYIDSQLADGDLLMEESAQVWINDSSRKMIFACAAWLVTN